MPADPCEKFSREFPQLAARSDELVDAQRSLPGLDAKTKQLVNIAIQTANRNPRGARFHATIARQAGATRAEVLGAVVLNLHLSGLAAVLDCLPLAVEGFGET